MRKFKILIKGIMRDDGSCEARCSAIGDSFVLIEVLCSELAWVMSDTKKEDVTNEAMADFVRNTVLKELEAMK